MPTRTHRHLSALLLVTAAAPALAAQNDQQPTDFISLPHGTTNVTLYAARQSFDGRWKNGIQTPSVEGSANLTVLRANRHFSIGEEGKYTVAPLILLTASETTATAASAPMLGGSASGLGDLRLGTAFWFHSDHVNREYVMATMIVTLPTGAYTPTQAINISENRIKTVLSLGWMQTLGSSWVLDLVPEVAFFGDNKEYLGNSRLSQDTAYAMSGTLRYKATQSIHWYATAQINRGGATQRNGIALTGAPDNTRLALGALVFSSDKSHIQLRYAKDVQIENGLRNTGEIMLRWSTVF
jgi:hypothetical protein